MPKGVYYRSPSLKRKLAKHIVGVTTRLWATKSGRKKMLRAMAKAGRKRAGTKASLKHCRAISKGLKEAWKRKSYRKRWSESWQSHRRRNCGILSRIGKDRWQDPVLRASAIGAMQGIKRSEEAKLNIRKGHNTTLAKRHHSKASKRLWKKKSHREHMAPVLDRIHYEMRNKFTSKIQRWSFWSLVHRFGKGLRLNYRIGTRIGDIVCPELKTIFELDGFYWHTDKNARRRRDSYLNSMGWKVFHFLASERHKREIVLEMLCLLNVIKRSFQ